MKKTVFTLCVDNYEPEITEITFPLLKGYADKIEADFYIIQERKFPDLPVVCEKLQVYTLGQQMKNDWNIFIDADTLIRPEMIDITNNIHKDTVAFNKFEWANIRFRYDKYLLKDGRNLGVGNWFAVASDWCIDLWHPLDDMTKDEALSNIFPSSFEVNNNIDREHLLDDYIVSRNIAKYGFKTTKLWDVWEKIGLRDGDFLHHLCSINKKEKIEIMRTVLNKWGVK